MDKDSWIIIAAIAAVAAFMWSGHASLDRRLQQIEASVGSMNTRLGRIEGRLDIPQDPDLERAQASPAPLAHWYFAPRIATGSSVVYGHATMPRS